jgi:hypothetical protein
MPAPTQAATEPVNAFPIDNTVLIKHYFEGDDVFARLKPYYNGNAYRFEVPVGEFDSLRRYLFDHGYELTVIERQEPFYVVLPQYSAHPDGIFKQSVRHEVADGYHCFLMKDREAVEAMVVRGAERLASKPLVLECCTLAEFGPLSA